MKTYTISREQLESQPGRNSILYPGVTDSGEYIYSEVDNRFSPVAPVDFDSGLGIGGLGRHIEQPVVPTIAAIERVERTEKTAIYCRKCGQSDVWDGAMFTTGGGDVCDDCYC